MHDRRFDDLTRRLGGSRRRFLTQAIGLAGAAAVGGLAAGDAEAARRGYSGPPVSAPQGTPSISIVFEATADGGCLPHARLASFPRNTETQATWYVTHGTTTLGPYYGQAITDADGFGGASFPVPPGSVLPGPNVSVQVAVTPVTASAPVRCSS